jgi:hypothetical protein
MMYTNTISPEAARGSLIRHPVDSISLKVLPSPVGEARVASTQDIDGYL